MRANRQLHGGAISTHIRGNAIGYIALFISLTGTAYATNNLPTAGHRAHASKSRRGPRGLTGAQGPQGAQGAQGPQGGAGASGSPDTGSQILTKLAPVDGSGSGLDADTLDGLDSNAFVTGAGTIPGASDLSGTYASPSIKAGSVGTSKFAALPTGRMAGNPGSGAFVAGNGTTSFPLCWGTTSFSTGGVTTGNGTAADCGLGPGGGLVQFNVPAAGTYLLTAYLTWPANATGYRKLEIKAGPSGTEAVAAVSQDQPVQESGQVTTQTVSGLVRLASGDRVFVQATQDSGTGLTVQAPNGFSISWLGP
jgi:hypothetical protein